MKKTALNHSIVHFKKREGFVLSKNKDTSTVFDFDTEKKMVVSNKDMVSKFHFDYNIFNKISDNNLCLFAKDFNKHFYTLMSDFNHTFNLQDSKISTDNILDDIEVIEMRMANLDKSNEIYKCYYLFKKYMSNTLFLTSKITASEHNLEPFSSNEIKNIIKHIE
jgi:hypothetical protein